MVGRENLEGLLDELDRLIREGDQEAIEARFKGLLAEMEDSGQASSNEYLTIVNELAGWYRGISRYADSEACFNKVLEVLEASGMEHTVQQARVLLNLAGLYRLTGQFDKSLACNLRAKEALEADPRRDGYAFATMLNSLSLTYQASGEYALAEVAASEVLELVKAEAQMGEHEIATALNNLAGIRIKLGDLDGAEELSAEALGYYRAMERENLHHGAALATMGTILYSKGRYREAAEVFEEACAATERFFGKNIEFAIGKHNLAMSCQALGDYPSAIAYQKTASEVIEGILGPEHGRSKEYRAYLEALEQKAASA
jgi:tetratricopeptide (TPR) repeat protein